MKELTQKNIAKKADVSSAFISLILSGRRRPSWKIAKKLASATGTTIPLWMEGTPGQIRAAVFEAGEDA